jgi:hypothetical protein
MPVGGSACSLGRCRAPFFRFAFIHAATFESIDAFERNDRFEETDTQVGEVGYYRFDTSPLRDVHRIGSADGENDGA